MIEIKSNGFSKKNCGEITSILPASTEHYLLMIIGWYQVMTQEEHAAVAASAA